MSGHPLHDRNGNLLRFPGSVLLLALVEPDPEEKMPEQEIGFRRRAAGGVAQIEQFVGGRVEVRIVNPKTGVPHYILSDPHDLEVVPR